MPAAVDRRDFDHLRGSNGGTTVDSQHALGLQYIGIRLGVFASMRVEVGQQLRQLDRRRICRGVARQRTGADGGLQHSGGQAAPMPGGTAQHPVLLDQHHASAQSGCLNGCSATRCATADDCDVELAVHVDIARMAASTVLVWLRIASTWSG